MYVKAEQRHAQAMMAPRGAEEKAITSILQGIASYVELLERLEDVDHRRRLGDVLTALAISAQSLLDGPLGRLSPELLRHQLGELIQRADHCGTVVQLSESRQRRRA